MDQRKANLELVETINDLERYSEILADKCDKLEAEVKGLRNIEPYCANAINHTVVLK
jgi:hypothetical protein